MKEANNNSRGWMMDFIIGVLATAIGVGLSFAVNNMVENHKKDQIRRHTAMMAIYDIDEIARHLKEYRQKEDNSFNITMYLDTHQDEIDSISVDSLRIAATYLIEDKSATFEWGDDSKEKAFNSSLDAWHNLENSQFYDNVLACYRQRSELLKMMESEVVFIRPISDEEFSRFFMQVKDSELDYSGSLNAESLARLLKKVLQQPTTTRFLRTYFLRNVILGRCADKLTSLNQENKVLMGITDKDIENYIKTNVDKTRPLTEKKLIGKWIYSQDEDREENFIFNPDNTITLSSRTPFSMSIYLDEEDVTVPMNCPISFSIDGSWALIRDSLKMKFDAESSKILSFDIDLNNLPKSAIERKKDSLDIWKQELQGYIHRYLKQSDWEIDKKASLDITGNLLILTSEQTYPWGETETDQQQLVRQKGR